MGGRLFQTCDPAAAKVLSPKLLRISLTASVRVSAEHSCLTRASAGVSNELTVVGQVTWGVAGQGPVDESRSLEQEASAAGGAQVRYDHIAWCPL